MQTMRRVSILAAATIALVAVASVAWRLDVAFGARPTVPSLHGTDVFAAGMRPAPPFALRDQRGRLVRLRAFRGRVVAITFLDSRCTTQCPLVGRELASAQHILGSRYSPPVLIVSVAPGLDTRASVDHFVREAGIVGDWHWLIGTRRQLAPVWRAYGIYVRPTQHDIVHTAALYLIGGDGSVRVADAVPLSPQQLAQSVQALTSTVRSG